MAVLNNGPHMGGFNNGMHWKIKFRPWWDGEEFLQGKTPKSQPHMAPIIITCMSTSLALRWDNNSVGAFPTTWKRISFEEGASSLDLKGILFEGLIFGHGLLPPIIVNKETKSWVLLEWNSKWYFTSKRLKKKIGKRERDDRTGVGWEVFAGVLEKEALKVRMRRYK